MNKLDKSDAELVAPYASPENYFLVGPVCQPVNESAFDDEKPRLVTEEDDAKWAETLSSAAAYNELD
jgi:hypothetical protein